MKDETFAIIKSYADASDNKCGITVPIVLLDLKIDYATLKSILNELITEKKIKVRTGINGHLLFLK